MKTKFDGCFNRKKKYCAYKYSQKLGKQIEFDEALYNKVSKEIVDILGDKKKYTIMDAVNFFKTKYQAFQIPWNYLLKYEDTSINYLDLSPAALGDDEVRPFEYNRTDKEKNITLVIDTVYNTSLRERYPDILRTEVVRKKLAEEMPDVLVYLHSNPIIVIGTINGESINSMLCYGGGAEYIISIPDIDYEMWFFYNH